MKIILVHYAMNMYHILEYDMGTLTETTGRIGTKGTIEQYKVYDDNHIHIVANKLKHIGYMITNEKSLDQLVIESKIVGIRNKCINLRWVEILKDSRGIGLHSYKPADDNMLSNPSAEPGIYIEMLINNKSHAKLRLLFTSKNVYHIKHPFNWEKISKSNPLYKFINKIEKRLWQYITPTIQEPAHQG